MLNVLTISHALSKNEIKIFKDTPDWKDDFLNEQLNELERHITRKFNAIIEEKVHGLHGTRRVLMKSLIDHTHNGLTILRVAIGLELNGLEESVMCRLSSDDLEPMEISTKGFRHVSDYDFGTVGVDGSE